MNEIRKYSISELIQGIRKNDFTISEVREVFLSAIRENEDLNAFITVCNEESQKEIDKLKNHNRLEMPLYGVPVAIKDLISTKGIRTTCASKILKDYIPPYNATVVERLLKVGSYIIGKTNLDEFAMGSSGENSYFGACKNPWNKEYVPGGSGGGTAVAVAAGLAPYSIGSDTGGSVRQPASFCGVVGLKPTYGRISRYGLIAFASSLDQIGIITRDVSDLSIVLQQIAGKDSNDATSMDVEVEDYSLYLRDDIKGLKIGVPKEYFCYDLQEDVKLALTNALKEFENLGCEIVDISLPHNDGVVSAYYIISSAEASSNLNRYDGIRYGFKADNTLDLNDLYLSTRSEGFGKEVKRRILMGTYVLSKGYYEKYYLRASKVRRLIVNDFSIAFKSCDLIFAPVAPTPPFKFGQFPEPLQMYLQDIYTLPASLAGLPALSIPCGFSKEKLPIGLQLIGNYWHEGTLIKAGFNYQKNTSWHKCFCF